MKAIGNWISNRPWCDTYSISAMMLWELLLRSLSSTLLLMPSSKRSILAGGRGSLVYFLRKSVDRFLYVFQCVNLSSSVFRIVDFHPKKEKTYSFPHVTAIFPNFSSIFFTTSVTTFRSMCEIYCCQCTTRQQWCIVYCSRPCLCCTCRKDWAQNLFLRTCLRKGRTTRLLTLRIRTAPSWAVGRWVSFILECDKNLVFSETLHMMSTDSPCF